MARCEPFGNKTPTISLSETARGVRNDRLTYLSAEKLNRLEEGLNSAIEAGATGDVLEFGVALGGSAIVLAKAACRYGRTFHGFDVFGIIPPPVSDHDDEKSKRRYEDIAAGRSKGIGGDAYYGYRRGLFEEVQASFSRYRVPGDGKTVWFIKACSKKLGPAIVAQPWLSLILTAIGTRQ